MRSRALLAIGALLVGCSEPPDPAIGQWVCADRFVGDTRLACPVTLADTGAGAVTASWQLDLGPESALFVQGTVDDALEPVGEPAVIAMSAERLEEGAWRLEALPLPDDAASTDVQPTLRLNCVLSAGRFLCAGSDDDQTWELRFSRIN